ncbi:hypothetical protein [Nocardia sp. CA-145437]|uniref:hypothetical protein n=1 Tax=Nocardia sp. CA-145437 TaxID=3239980 RepID=UPI003D973CB3
MNPDPFEADLAAIDPVSGAEILAAADSCAMVAAEYLISSAYYDDGPRLRPMAEHDSEWFDPFGEPTEAEQAEFAEWWEKHRGPEQELGDWVDWRDPWGNSIS